MSIFFPARKVRGLGGRVPLVSGHPVEGNSAWALGYERLGSPEVSTQLGKAGVRPGLGNN